MNDSRRSFLAKCASGLCACGFSGLAAAIPGEAGDGAPKPKPTPSPMPSMWIAAILSGLEKNPDPALAKTLLKGCSLAHFEHLDMDRMLSPYVGHLESFLAFISREWGWAIQHDKASGVILIDEAKTYCVCPLMHEDHRIKSALLCECSAGFAEKMFSTVLKAPVRVQIEASILRGAKSCRYRIET